MGSDPPDGGIGRTNAAPEGSVSIARAGKIPQWGRRVLAAMLVSLVGGAYWLKTRPQPATNLAVAEPTATLHTKSNSRHTARQSDAALETSRNAPKDASRQPLAPFDRGVALLESGQADEAIKWLTAARREDGKRADTHYYLGLAFLRQQRLGEAMDALRRALELDPGHAGAHIALAKVYLARGERASALEEFAKAAKLNPYARQ